MRRPSRPFNRTLFARVHRAAGALALSGLFAAMGSIVAPAQAEMRESQLTVFSDGSSRLAVVAAEPCVGGDCDRVALNCDDGGVVTITVYELPAPDAGLWLASRKGAALEGLANPVPFEVVSFSARDGSAAWTAWLHPAEPGPRPEWLSELGEVPTLTLATAIGDIFVPAAGDDRDNLAGFAAACLGERDQARQ